MNLSTDALVSALREGGPAPQEQKPGILKSRQAYNNYVMNCASSGSSPLPFPDWVTSGSPESCSM